MVTNSPGNIPTGASGTVLQGQGVGSASAFSTATYPATATGTGTILRADGTNWSATTSTYPNTNAVSTLLYASSANVMSALATANSAILNTNSSGVPSITASPTIGANNAATLVTIASNSATALAFDNGVAHGTIPLIDFYHDAATAATDYAYELDFNAQNSTPAKKLYASLQAQVSVNTASSEMGTFLINTINAGSSQVNVKVGNNLGQYRGTQTNTAPPAGFIGEYISSFNSAGQGSSGTGNPFNVTSISVTAGIWDISGVVTAAFTGSSTSLQMAVTSTSATVPAIGGDNAAAILYAATVSGYVTLSIPAYRVTLSAATTTYYLVAEPVFSTNTCTAYGRISATRVG